MHVNINVLITLIPLPYLSPLILIPLLVLLIILLLGVISILLLVLLLLLSAVLLMHPVSPELLSCVYAILLIARSAPAIALVASLVSAAILLVAMLLSSALMVSPLPPVASPVTLLLSGVFAHFTVRAWHDIFVGLLVAAPHCILGMCIVLIAHTGAAT